MGALPFSFGTTCLIVEEGKNRWLQAIKIATK
jgi:hypothetical protein